MAQLLLRAPALCAEGRSPAALAAAQECLAQKGTSGVRGSRSGSTDPPEVPEGGGPVVPEQQKKRKKEI